VVFRRAKEQVVICFGIERRIGIDEIDRFVANVVAQNLQVVAEVRVFSAIGSGAF